MQSVIPDREHVVKIPPRDMDRLRTWLKAPNGSLRIGRACFEAVEDAGILVRTDPYRYQEPNSER